MPIVWHTKHPISLWHQLAARGDRNVFMSAFIMIHHQSPEDGSQVAEPRGWIWSVAPSIYRTQSAAPEMSNIHIMTFLSCDSSDTWHKYLMMVIICCHCLVILALWIFKVITTFDYQGHFLHSFVLDLDPLGLAVTTVLRCLGHFKIGTYIWANVTRVYIWRQNMSFKWNCKTSIVTILNEVWYLSSAQQYNAVHCSLVHCSIYYSGVKYRAV